MTDSTILRSSIAYQALTNEKNCYFHFEGLRKVNSIDFIQKYKLSTSSFITISNLRVPYTILLFL